MKPEGTLDDIASGMILDVTRAVRSAEASRVCLYMEPVEVIPDGKPAESALIGEAVRGLVRRSAGLGVTNVRISIGLCRVRNSWWSRLFLGRSKYATTDDANESLLYECCPQNGGRATDVLELTMSFRNGELQGKPDIGQRPLENVATD